MTTTYNHSNLNELAQIVHQANIKWWQNIDTGEPIKRNSCELKCLIISEISEALEGERKDLMDDKLSHRKMAEVEMADTYIRILDYCAGFEHLISKYPYVNSTNTVHPNKGHALYDIITQVVNAYDGEDWKYVIDMIRIYCEKHGYNLEEAFAEKMEYNRTRQDHTHEARRIAGGKQF